MAEITIKELEIKLNEAIEEIAELKKSVAKLTEKLKQSTVQHEEVAKEEKVDISGLSFNYDKTKYVFSRPSVAIKVKNNFETFTAKEVMEDKELQEKFAKMAAAGETNFVVAVK